MNRLFEEDEWNYRYAMIPIMILVVVFVLWASLSELDEVVRGDGKVVPSGQTKVLQHLEGGIISNILVKEGDVVKKGDVLYELSQAFFEADFKTKDIELKSLQAKAIRLNRQIEFKNTLQFPAHLESTIPEITANERSIFEEELRSNVQKIGIAEDQLKQKILKEKDLEAKRESLSLELRLANENMKILDQMYKKQVVSKQEYLKELQLKQTLITKITDIDTSIPIVREEISEAEGKLKAVVLRGARRNDVLGDGGGSDGLPARPRVSGAELEDVGLFSGEVRIGIPNERIELRRAQVVLSAVVITPRVGGHIGATAHGILNQLREAGRRTVAA